ncbi:hypothetical protein SHIRM173S_11845 [Streptomyces hirsutus]
MDGAVGQADAGEPVVLDHQFRDLAGHHTDTGRGQPAQVLVGQLLLGDRVQEEGDVLGPPGHHQRLVHTHGAGGEHPERLVADLPAVAERAVQHVPSEPFGDPGDSGQFVLQPGGDDQPPRADGPAVVQQDGEPRVTGAGTVPGHVRHPAREQFDAVARDLLTAGGQERGR